MVRRIAIGLLVCLTVSGCLSIGGKEKPVEAAPPPPEAHLAAIDAPEAVAIDTQAAPRKGILGFLKRRADAAKAEAPEELGEAKADDPVIAAETSPEAAEPALAEAEPKKKSIFGFLRRGAPKPEPEAEPEAKVIPASVPAPSAEAPAAAEAKAEPAPAKRGWFFARAKATTKSASAPKPGDIDYQQVGPGVTLPYGQVARLCGVEASKLGKRIGRYPESGSGFALYDSAPNQTAQRSFFVTGFDDGCARQFTAALAMFGGAQMHEMLRYSLPEKVRAYSETDSAYETLKRRMCGVGKGKPCGDKADEMDRSTVFVSTYERFESSNGWYNLLLHDGAVLAMDRK